MALHINTYSRISSPRRFIQCFLIFACLMFTANAEPALNGVLMLGEPPAPDSGQSHPVVYWDESWDTPRPVQIHFIRIDLKSSEYEVFTILADDPDADGPAEGELVSPEQLARRHGAVAAVNANAFRLLGGGDAGARRSGWRQGEAVDIAGIAVSYGALRSRSEPLLSTLWFDHSGIPHVEDLTDVSDVLHAVSGWIDRLLLEGTIMTKKNRSLHPRTLAGIDRGRRYLLLVIADGRNMGYSEGITLYEAAVLMKEKGCHDAVNLDGGGSSVMIVQRDGDLRIMNSPSGGASRPIPVMLGVRKRLPPDERGEDADME